MVAATSPSVKPRRSSKRSAPVPAASRDQRAVRQRTDPSPSTTSTTAQPGVAVSVPEPITKPSVASSKKAEVDRLYAHTLSRLGTFVAEASARFAAASCWESFVIDEHGPPHLQPDIGRLPHPASPLLASIHDHGVPVYFDDPDWDLATLDAAMEKGCNYSAEVHKRFIAEEMLEFGGDGFWTILPYSLVRHLPGLRLSPAQIKEERDRRPRFIADHRTLGVNDHTLPVAPKEAMQFGGTLYRLLWHIRHANPRFGHVHIAKFDVKDGFYRIHLRPAHCPRLAIVLPRYEGLPPLSNAWVSISAAVV